MQCGRIKKVDVYDQLAFKLKKSYNSLFLDLLDLALVNAYIANSRSPRAKEKSDQPV